MIDIRKLKELVRLMVANELTELDLRDSEEQVTLRRPAAPGSTFGGETGAATAVAPPPVVTSVAAAAIEGDGDPDDGLITIESPMVGTFYSAANPDSEPFVTEGKSVGRETVVCIIEAMKIFNEIKAECAGSIERILVKNGEAVEYGQPLYRVRPT